MQEIAILASRALTTQRQFTAIADNVANVNTAGYRKINMDFKEVLANKTTAGAQPASYVADYSLSFSQESGVLQSTGNPFDVAIGGEGYFAIDVNGTRQYTRKGQFVVDNTGVLTTPQGNPVLDNTGAQIQLPENIKNISIGNDGTISTKGDDGQVQQLVQLGVYVFTPQQMKGFQRVGNAAYLPQEGVAPTVAEAPSVRQGYLEASNVNAVQEMVNMEMVSKAYQSSISLLGSLNELESSAIRTLGKVQ